MENRIEEILFEYTKADLTRRLHMFLTYPGLRRRFRGIDCREMPLQQLESNIPLQLPGPCRRIFRRLANAMRLGKRDVNKIISWVGQALWRETGWSSHNNR